MSTIQRRAAWVLAAVVASPWACASRPPAPPPAPPVISVAGLRAEEDRIVSMRARFTARTTYGGEERSADGVLLVQKPDRFRLRLYLPLGLTVFDYLARGDRTWITMPMRRERDQPLPEDLQVFSRADLGQAFLRGDYAFPGTCTATTAPDEVIVICRVGEAIVREIRVARATGTISREISYVEGTPHLVLRYADYRWVGGQQVPFSVSMQYPVKGMSVDIVIKQYELNLPLADALFQPPEES